MDIVAKSVYIASLMVPDAAANPLTRMLNESMSQGGETVELGEDVIRLGRTLDEVARRPEA